MTASPIKAMSALKGKYIDYNLSLQRAGDVFSRHISPQHYFQYI